MAKHANLKAKEVAQSAQLRKEAGLWLRARREARGMSQRDLAQLVEVEYYTFISQIEAGRGRVPPDRLNAWAEALQMDPQVFVKTLMRFYDPITYGLLFPETVEQFS
jgi:transcriptional regulator with XRE-family HTH domain